MFSLGHLTRFSGVNQVILKSKLHFWSFSWVLDLIMQLSPRYLYLNVRFSVSKMLPNLWAQTATACAFLPCELNLTKGKNPKVPDSLAPPSSCSKGSLSLESFLFRQMADEGKARGSCERGFLWTRFGSGPHHFCLHWELSHMAASNCKLQERLENVIWPCSPKEEEHKQFLPQWAEGKQSLPHHPLWTNSWLTPPHLSSPS